MAKSSDPRRRLMFVAAGLSLAFVGLSIFLMLRSTGASNQERQSAQPPVVDIFEPLIASDPDAASASGGSGLFIQVSDRDDPSRTAMELRSEQMDPIGRDLYSVTAPRAWVFMTDGASVSITAEAGTLVLPDRAREPEQGTLTGGVVIKRYPKMDRRPDPAQDQPEATFTSDTLTFDLTLGEVATPDRVVITSTLGELVGTDMRMNINEALERVDLFRLQQGEYLRIRRSPEQHAGPAAASNRAETPANASTNGDTGASTTPGDTSTTPGAPRTASNADAPAPAQQTESASDLLESFYSAVFRDNVVLVDEGRRIEGDQLELWARLVDNQLVPGAIEAPNQPGRASTEEPETDEPAGVASASEASLDARPDPESSEPAPQAASAQSQQAKAAETQEDIVLTWSGVAEIRPMAARPAELAEDEVAARVTASVTGRVQMSDPASSSRASTGALEYYATRRHIVMTSPGMTGVELVSERDGLARFGRLELSLATGIGFAPGAGTVESADGSGRVTWNEQADLIFETDERGMTGVLREAMCSGAARAQKDDASIESDFLRTVFETDASGGLQITRLAARGDVIVNDGKNAGGEARALDVQFAPLESGGDFQPSALVARGDARFRDGDDIIEADIIDATLRAQPDGGLRVSHLRTSGSTRIQRAEDNLLVTGGEVEMFDDRQDVRIAGPDAVAQRDGVRITAVAAGDVIELDGTGRSGRVTGAGSFSRQTRNADGSTGSITAAWSESMQFDDRAGTLECVGDVQAVHEPDASRRDAVLGHRVTATFEPFREEAPEAESPEANAPERQVLTFRAIGASDGASPAAVESARFEVLDGQEPRLARALRLTGPDIRLDQAAGTVLVEGAGSLLVSDQRQVLPPERQALALFSWNDTFTHDRASGQATMIGGVKTHHRRRADEPVTLIDCDRLDAVLIDPQQGDLAGDPSQEAQLRSARAQGNVSMKSGTREAIAGTADYDALSGAAVLSGPPGGVVTMIDTARTGLPTQAGQIRWNLRNDRIDILNAGTFRGSP